MTFTKDDLKQHGTSPTIQEEIMSIKQEIADIKVDVAPIPGNELVRPAKRPKYAALNNTKLAPLRDYREALREYLVK